MRSATETGRPSDAATRELTARLAVSAAAVIVRFAKRAQFEFIGTDLCLQTHYVRVSDGIAFSGL
jgi:hypothetical protein